MSGFDPRSIEVVSRSDTGLQRANNQDSWGEGRSPDGGRLLIVADGMGGHAGGETASRTAVEAARAIVEGASEAPEVALRIALEGANQAIFDAARQDAALTGMGTTGVAMLFPPGPDAIVANVGDSRAYRLRGGEIEQLTEDHSLVAELHRRGVITQEEAAVHPRRNEVLRSLGIQPEVAVDILRVALAPGDRYLLCSDGLSGVVSDAEIAELLDTQEPGQAADALIALANERGGPDNITVQIARLPDAAASATPALADAEDRARNTRLLSLAAVGVAVLLGLVLLFALRG